MKFTSIGVVALLSAAVGSPAWMAAQSGGPLPVSGYNDARDVEGAHELPDPAMDYKVVFAVANGAKERTDVNPMLPTVATYLNTLAAHGVSADHRHLAVMFHQRSDDVDIVMRNEAYKTRYGIDNPNIALIHALKQAGVDLRVCGQALSARKIDPAQVNPDIQIDLWALTSLVNLQMKGYVRVG
ncbi:MAG: DsrE family protein [Acidobacteriota bacterium]|nr:DsrE family protein [Acidobacteriota bacterium]